MSEEINEQKLDGLERKFSAQNQNGIKEKFDLPGDAPKLTDKLKKKGWKTNSKNSYPKSCNFNHMNISEKKKNQKKSSKMENKQVKTINLFDSRKSLVRNFQ